MNTCKDCDNVFLELTDDLCDDCFGVDYQLDAEADARTDEDVE